MSTQPEEFEEGEIVSESEEEEQELEEEEEEEELDMFDENDELDIATLMTSLLATEDGDTVCTALINISRQLQTQNKILIKMLSKL